MPPKPLHTKKCAKPEGLCNNLADWTFLTLTFRKVFHVVPVKTLFYRTLPWILKRLWRIAKEEWTLCPEITLDGVLHYHIVMKTTQYVRRAAFINCWKARYGEQTKLNPVYCLLGCKLYMRKQNKELAPILEWPFRLCMMRGSCLPLIRRILVEKLLQRNALKRANEYERSYLSTIEAWFSSIHNPGMKSDRELMREKSHHTFQLIRP